MADEAPRPALTGVCPLLSVYDMNRAVAFYRDLLGFALVEHAPFVDAAEGHYFHWAWLRRGPAELMLNTAYDANERPPSVDPARQAAHADSYLYFGCHDPDAVYADLIAHGVAAEAPKNAPYGMRQVFLTDPDGYHLVFQKAVSA